MSQGNQAKKLRMDSKGRISVGKFVPEGVTGFVLAAKEDGSILLTPTVEIPAKEAWLFQNTKALASVMRGLKQSSEGKTKRGAVNFEKYVYKED